ncbi:MAG: nucleic acid-binding OB-fold tRNA/helicase-type [Comamonadaceae bacterium]|nr:MAG: nucleic acid-binding OB-fold tRNA/helicase-type [Comamonadaceae bacterium]
MKTLLAISLLVVASISPSTWAASEAAVVSGEVLETKDVDGYTYLRLKTKDGETWAAVSTTSVKKGAKVTIENSMVMSNFESKTLKKTFPSIVFGKLAGSTTGGKETLAAHGSQIKLPIDTSPIKVAKASGANAYTVAEVVTKAVALKDKPVQVNGKVVKFNAGIMGKNWVHLRDGTGSESNASNDILVTTSDRAQLGDVVTVSGMVRNDKDFGAGYSYKVLIEEATLKAINK